MMCDELLVAHGLGLGLGYGERNEMNASNHEFVSHVKGGLLIQYKIEFKNLASRQSGCDSHSSS
jgi:hypothetical protein